MVEFAAVIAPVTKALALSLGVERVLEVGKNILESVLGPSTVRQVPPATVAEGAVEALATELTADTEAKAVEERGEAAAKARAAESKRLQEVRARLRAAELAPGDEATRKQVAALRLERVELTAKLRRLEQQGEWAEQVGTSLVLAVPATDPDDGKVVKTLVLQLLGFAAGILLAHVAGVSLFRTFLGPDTGLSIPVDYILTGLLIGGGSAPMHVLVRFLTERQVVSAPPAAAEATPEESQPPAAEAPALIVTPPREDVEGWVELAYSGGVDREKLQHVHLRPADPDLIVYHHTAMDSRSTFDDVVRVITNRTSGGASWLTGYNCVILADGSVRPFCRWDRYGNHAVGYNRRSLGLAFNGNFETDPGVPFSNPDGRLGATRPTEEQLRAGARVVALWTFLYAMPVGFGASILPHKQISSKACPGSQFPYGEFQRWVEHYCAQWARSGAVQERIAAFKLKPYLYRAEVRS